MFVFEAMTKNPVTITDKASVSEARKLMQQEKIHRLPVLNKKNELTGIITEKDLLKHTPSSATTLDVYEISNLLLKLTVNEVMTTKPLFVEEDTPIEDAARIMSDNNIGGLTVLRNGKVVGIITESDIFKVFIELFGTRQSGIRATILIPDKKGELADVLTAIRDSDGDVISLGTFLGDDPGNVLCTLKVKDISADNLRKCLVPLVEKIIDIREV